MQYRYVIHDDFPENQHGPNHKLDKLYRWSVESQLKVHQLQ